MNADPETRNDPKQDSAEQGKRDIRIIIPTAVEKCLEKLKLAGLSRTPQTHCINRCRAVYLGCSHSVSQDLLMRTALSNELFPLMGTACNWFLEFLTAT